MYLGPSTWPISVSYITLAYGKDPTFDGVICASEVRHVSRPRLLSTEAPIQ